MSLETFAEFPHVKLTAYWCRTCRRFWPPGLPAPSTTHDTPDRCFRQCRDTPQEISYFLGLPGTPAPAASDVNGNGDRPVPTILDASPRRDHAQIVTLRPDRDPNAPLIAAIAHYARQLLTTPGRIREVEPGWPCGETRDLEPFIVDGEPYLLCPKHHPDKPAPQPTDEEHPA